MNPELTVGTNIQDKRDRKKCHKKEKANLLLTMNLLEVSAKSGVSESNSLDAIVASAMPKSFKLSLQHSAPRQRSLTARIRPISPKRIQSGT